MPIIMNDCYRCGKHGRITFKSGSTVSGWGKFHIIRCENCEFEISGRSNSDDEAISQWNRLSPTGEEVREIRARVKDKPICPGCNERMEIVLFEGCCQDERAGWRCGCSAFNLHIMCDQKGYGLEFDLAFERIDQLRSGTS